MNPLILYDTPFEAWIAGSFFLLHKRACWIMHIYTDRELDQ